MSSNSAGGTSSSSSSSNELGIDNGNGEVSQNTQPPPPAIRRRQCPSANCGSFNYETTGDGVYCSDCGVVIDNTAFDMSVSFTDNQDGSRSMNGQFVSNMSTTPYRFTSAGGVGMARESRDVTISNGKKRIQTLAAALKLNNLVDPAHRLFLTAVQRNFVHGRKTANVVAACLYVACRQRQAPHLLIDFSDVLQTNVFVLGNTFLKFRRLLQLNLPAIDPAHYINRFASKLEFGKMQHKVTQTAIALVKRMKRDWLHTGRRPSGICGAALLLAARVHNLSRSQKEMVTVMRICEDTLRRRLNEFQATPAGNMSIDDFFTKGDFLEDCEPPSYMANRLREAEALKEQEAEQKALEYSEKLKQVGDKSNENDVLLLTDAPHNGQGGIVKRRMKEKDMYQSIEQEILSGGNNSTHAAELLSALHLMQPQVADMLPPGVAIKLPPQQQEQGGKSGSDDLEEKENDDDAKDKSDSDSDHENEESEKDGADANDKVGKANDSGLENEKEEEKEQGDDDNDDEQEQEEDEEEENRVKKKRRKTRKPKHQKALVKLSDDNKVVLTQEEIDIQNAGPCKYNQQQARIKKAKELSNIQIADLMKRKDVFHVDPQDEVIEYRETLSGKEIIIETTAEQDDKVFEDDEEINAMIMTEEEQKIAKMRWHAENVDYLEKEKRERAEGKVKRKRKRKLRDGEVPTALESTKQMVESSKRLSKKVDYSKWSLLFEEDED